ncbi:MAG: hypothetical protein A2Y40_07675 [Candidatus Margulisbacteria bacterium GWF2_35_9]|nr:MAG: hypothetical protein A2Y40_07675 [Candidatus Margulisbacteria bacterium GWF2_35_9]
MLKRSWLLWGGLFLISSMLFPKMDSLDVDDSLSNKNIAPYVQYFVDSDGLLKISDIESIYLNNQFRLSNGNLNFGYSQKVYWFCFELNNRQVELHEMYLQMGFPFIDSIEMYIQNSFGEYSKYGYGDKYPFNNRSIKFRDFIIPIPPKNGVTRYFIRVQNEGNISLPISLWSENSFIDHIQKENKALGVYYGLILVMMLFNLVLFILMKDIGMLYFSIFIFFYFMFHIQFDGIGFQYLWPKNLFLQSYSLPWYAYMAGAFIILFIREDLKTKRLLPKIDFLLRGYLIITTILILISFLFSRTLYIQIATISSVLSSFFAFVVCIIRLRQKSKTALFYFFGYLVFVLGAIITLLSIFGVVNISFWSEWSIQIGSVLMVLVISIGMIDKINKLKLQYDKNVLRLKDIYERLAERFKQLDNKVATIKKLANSLSEITNDLSMKVETTNDGILHTAIAVDTVAEQTVMQNNMVNDLNNNILEIIELIIGVVTEGRNQSELLTNAAEKVMFNHKEILYQSGQASKQSEDLDQTKLVVKNMIEDVEIITEKSTKVAESALTAIKVAEEGERVVNNSVDGMNIIKEKIFNIAEKVDFLSSNTLKIEEIIEVIDNLSKQTNVLSLNAAIEASRAGAHGLGFAVVAEEVRHLAEKSVVFTKEIIAIINNIRFDAEELKKSMDKGIVEVMLGYELIQKMSKAFTRIIEDIRRTVEEIQNISSSSEDLSRKSSTVKEMLNTIYNSIDHNLTTMEQLSNNSEQIVSSIKIMKLASTQNQLAASEMSENYHAISKKIASISRISKDNTTAADRTSVITGDMAKSIGLIKNFILELDFMTVQLLKRG